MRGLCALCALAAGCASAHSFGGIDDAPNGGPTDSNDNITHDDARTDARPIDARPIDAGPPPIDAPHGVYMSETSSNGMMAAMVYGQSIACGDNGDDNTTDNTWWRVYKPSDYGVNDTFHVTEVDVSVQETSTTPTITVNVGTYAGTIDAATINTAQITNLATAQAPAPPTSGQTGESLKFPITATIPAGAQFIVSVAAPNQDITGTTDQYFYIGATSAADTHRAYLSSTGCGITTPELVSTVSGTAGYMIIDVQGTN